MKRLKAWMTIPLLAFFLAACESAAEEAVEKITAVNTAVIALSSIQSELSYIGQVKPAEQISVMSKIAGIVDEVMVDTGDYVEAGDILFTMEKTEILYNIRALEAQIATAEAAVAAARTGVSLAEGSTMQAQIVQAESAIQQTERGVEQAELAIGQRELGLNQAQNAYDNAKKNYDDTKALYEAGVSPKAQYDQADMALTNAEITLEQARANYDMAVVSLAQAKDGLHQATESHRLIADVAPSESARRAEDGLAQAVAQTDSLRVNLKIASERLGDTVITSPISGYISSRTVEPQMMLLQGLAPVTVVSTETVLVNVQVTEQIINTIEPGQQVTARITAADAKPFTGTVTIVSPAASEATFTFYIGVTIDNKNGAIKPGMFAEVFFVREKAERAVVIPRAALLNEDGVPVVYLAEGDRAVRRVVTTGIDNGAYVEITGGLRPGDVLITKGQTYVTDGATITILEDGGETR